jgi:hypothetical protein
MPSKNAISLGLACCHIEHNLIEVYVMRNTNHVSHLQMLQPQLSLELTTVCTQSLTVTS